MSDLRQRAGARRPPLPGVRAALDTPRRRRPRRRSAARHAACPSEGAPGSAARRPRACAIVTHATAPGATRSRSACARAGRSGRRRGCRSSTSPRRRPRPRRSRPSASGNRLPPSSRAVRCATCGPVTRVVGDPRRAPESGLFDEELGDAAGAPLAAPELSEVELADLPLQPAKVAGADECRAGRSRRRPARGPGARALSGGAGVDRGRARDRAGAARAAAHVGRASGARGRACPGGGAGRRSLRSPVPGGRLLHRAHRQGRSRVPRVGLAVARSRTRGCSRSSTPATSPVRPDRPRAS